MKLCRFSKLNNFDKNLEDIILETKVSIISLAVS